MSGCDLQIRFDRDDRTYRPGDVVAGEVLVTTDKEVACKELKVELHWQTHGAGNTDRQNLDTQVLETQPWNAGYTYRYPFRFTAPATPLTYRGHLLNVDHYVSARADLPWAIDPKASEDYLLLPGPTSRDDYLAAPVDFSQPKASTSPVAKALGWLLLPVILVLLVALLIMLIPILLVIFVVVFVRRRLAESRLGRVTVDVQCPAAAGWESKTGIAKVGSAVMPAKRGVKGRVFAVSPGDAVRFSLFFQPKTAAEVDRVSAELVAEEQCRSGSGTNAKTHTHAVHQQELTLAQAVSYMASAPVQLSGQLEVPASEAFSFKAASNTLQWTLKLRIDIPRWPDWTEEVALAMVPTPATQAGEERRSW